MHKKLGNIIPRCHVCVGGQEEYLLHMLDVFKKKKVFNKSTHDIKLQMHTYLDFNPKGKSMQKVFKSTKFLVSTLQEM